MEDDGEWRVIAVFFGVVAVVFVFSWLVWIILGVL